jgi:SAM-dependent methyltransferase
MKIAAQVAYWDRVAGEKRFSHPIRLDWLEQYLGPSHRSKVILDYGCGYGRSLAELVRSGYQSLVGVDFSAAMLDRCRREGPDISLVQNDGRKLPLKNGSVDVALLFAVLTCIPDGTDQENQLAEVIRVLRPGGLLYLSDLLINDDRRNRERYRQYADIYNCYGIFELPEGAVVRHHAREWIEELTGALEPLEYQPFAVQTMNGNNSSAFQYLGRKKK